jgi:MFS-type transporter involved in bile tolerance (Atg22 family)
VGGLVALRWRPRRPLSTAFTLGVAFSFPMLALAPPAPLLVIVLAVMLSAGVVELSNAWWYTLLQEHIPAEALSRVSSYDWLVSIVFQPIGFAIVGPIAAIVSAPVTLLGAAALSLASNLGAASIPAIRRLGWKETAPSPPLPTLPAEGPMAGRLEIDRPVSAPRDQLPQ